MDDFDTPDTLDSPATEQPTKEDPLRPKAVRGRYYLPDPVTGKKRGWQRTTNFVKLAEDTYHLELWKQRCVAKGLAMRPDYVEAVVPLDVKADRDQLNRICERAQDVAGAYKMSDEGTALHKSTELADFACGSLAPVMSRHHARVQLYLDALRVNGLSIPAGMIERLTVSQRYDVAGTFDRIFGLADGSFVIGDLKTSDSLDLSFHSISAQLATYENGVNETGIWDGRQYAQPLKVRTDFALVIHLPSTRDEVTVYTVDLAAGHELGRICLDVRQSRKVKARDVAQVFQPGAYGLSTDTVDLYWLEQLNAAHTVTQLISVADRARAVSQWNERLAGQARLLSKELTVGPAAMGS